MTRKNRLSAGVLRLAAVLAPWLSLQVCAEDAARLQEMFSAEPLIEQACAQPTPGIFGPQKLAPLTLGALSPTAAFRMTVVVSPPKPSPLEHTILGGLLDSPSASTSIAASAGALGKANSRPITDAFQLSVAPRQETQPLIEGFATRMPTLPAAHHNQFVAADVLRRLPFLWAGFEMEPIRGLQPFPPSRSR